MSEIMEPSLTYSLRNRTKSVHENLDDHLTDMGLFTDKEKYKIFLTLQYYVHQDAHQLYSNPQLAAIIPDLQQRNRIDKVKKDMLDLNVPIPEPISSPVITDISSAVGALYVVEGSKLGAKYLLNYIQTIGLSDQYGGNHLGADDEGRGASWRKFKSAIDSAKIDVAVAVRSAEQTFERIFAHVNRVTG